MYNSSFSTITPGLQLAWDNSSLDPLKQCARKYELSIKIGLETKERSIHLIFGLLYHEAHERFSKLLFKGMKFEDARREVVRWLLQATWNNGRPWNSGDTYKNRYTLVRSFVWYVSREASRNDAFELAVIDGKPAVELSFSFATSYYTKAGEPFLLCGHLDKIGSLQGAFFGKDYKTTKFNIDDSKFFDFYNPDNQMSLYTYSGKVIFKQPLQGMIIDAAQVLVGGTRFKRGFAPRTDGQLQEWYEELEDWLAKAEHYAKTGRYPMNETACGRYGGCQFRGICAKDPKVRELWLKNAFQRRTWDPLKIRGDI